MAESKKLDYRLQLKAVRRSLQAGVMKLLQRKKLNFSLISITPSSPKEKNCKHLHSLLDSDPFSPHTLSEGQQAVKTHFQFNRHMSYFS